MEKRVEPQFFFSRLKKERMRIETREWGRFGGLACSPECGGSVCSRVQAVCFIVPWREVGGGGGGWGGGTFVLDRGMHCCTRQPHGLLFICTCTQQLELSHIYSTYLFPFPINP